MSTEAALLRAIRDCPDDDTPRLVYADLVEEDGDAARGEFIRVQVALARTPETDPARNALEDREHELLAENEARWLGVPPETDGLLFWRFARGFVEEVSATPSFMLNEGSDLCAANPVRRWRVGSSQGDMAEDLIEAGRRGWFARLEALDLSGWFQAIGEMERFLTRSDFERLRELDLSDCGGLDDLGVVLERSALREQLRVLRAGASYGVGTALDAAHLSRALAPTRLVELSVPGCFLSADDVRRLLASDCCRELSSLNIRDNHIEPNAWDAFQAAECRLRSLDLSGTPLGAISLDDVLRQESLSELRVLHLNRCGSAMANMHALASSRFWTQAEVLQMQDGTIPERSLEPLFRSAGSPNLRVLDVGGNYFREDGVRGLCGAKWAGSLTTLNLSRNYLTNEAARLIAGCERFTQLRSLDLSYNNRHDQPDADPGDQITDAGLWAIIESPHLTNLRHLDVTGLQFTGETRAALQRRFGRGLRG
ncbi:Repeat-companion domain protein OS=Isosphaera pallida (strain ATCC 43644 / DSM 9630 / IS1B) GN=Isop_0391 PE=4 SV=1: LRR_6: LRR_6: LRR_6 [Gemmataceae bacterium]|nr:Repeat-companion domain protein OS=Isosphaera pallida (strain ATCC 43644 / DSM 9630 / IS1B) GN=Isop_0391 PE=4 SV=1: LRR_6: LRR_6: LRR_6 [Gemmataceae bacterium]VTT97356.1 Repeat-companion domain protein OS=Isosphaera pallida (strain ATCC 43644 / DSM 9630 / IS1B) GN=Isop_0391 PE=4 SV=1: LRR_6: LRR_6: LRR_6 [Gemmataceae bacterium]